MRKNNSYFELLGILGKLKYEADRANSAAKKIKTESGIDKEGIKHCLSAVQSAIETADFVLKKILKEVPND